MKGAAGSKPCNAKRRRLGGGLEAPTLAARARRVEKLGVGMDTRGERAGAETRDENSTAPAMVSCLLVAVVAEGSEASAYCGVTAHSVDVRCQPWGTVNAAKRH